MAPMLLLAVLAGSVPTLDLPSICRGEQSGIPLDRQARVYQDCIHDEQTARDELQRQWSQFPAAARGACAEMGRLVLSYVEVLICIEIKTGNAAIRGAPQTPPTSPPP
jgi:hypothetical protein